jgi:hypothetical protein
VGSLGAVTVKATVVRLGLQFSGTLPTRVQILVFALSWIFQDLTTLYIKR